MPLQALSDGVRLNVEEAGEGLPTLVPCIASSVPYERSFGDELKKDFRFIFVEVRGTARSEGEKDVSSLDQISDDLEDLRQQLGLEKVIAFAQSRNGMMAVHYAHKYPQSVLRTVTIGTPISLGPEYVLTEEYWDAVADDTRRRLRAENEAHDGASRALIIDAGEDRPLVRSGGPAPLVRAHDNHDGLVGAVPD